MEHHKNSEEKSGITTGSVATAASVAALLTILDKSPEVVDIIAPNSRLTAEIYETKKLSDNKACAVVEKPTYNDSDVTRGIKIISQVELTDNEGEVEITAGEGVGVVTKPGLQIPVGEYAINPVPRKMIKDNVKRYLPNAKGAVVKKILQKNCKKKLY